MTNQEFIQKIVSYYKESGELTINPSPFKIWRGVNHSISSKAEDLFALFVAKRLNEDTLEYIVDKTFSMKKKGADTVQFRPDLAIVKDGQITHMFDLKMDMGYKRRYHETEKFDSNSELFRRLRHGDYDSLSFKKNNLKFEFKASHKIINQIVVISEKNEGRETNRIDMINSISNLDWVKIYYLSGDVHPNKYIDKMPTIREENFENLFNDIRQYFQ